MKPKKLKHPREIADRDEKARAFWRWTFEAVKEKQKEKKRLDIEKANVTQIDGKKLDESFDSDQSQKQEDFTNFSFFVRICLLAFRHIHNFGFGLDFIGFGLLLSADEICPDLLKPHVHIHASRVC